MRAGLLVARTIRSVRSIFSTSRLRPAKKKVSPGESWLANAFLDAAEIAAVLEADVEHRRLDDDARVEPMLRNEAGVGDPPRAVGSWSGA